MENDDHNRRPGCFIGTGAGAAHDEAQVGNGGIGQHLLPVGLGNGGTGSEEESNAPDQHGHNAGMIISQNRRQLDNEEHPGLHHGRRMEQSRRRRRRHHGPQKPAGERHHGRLRKAAEHQKRHHRLHRHALHTHGKKLGNFKGIEMLSQIGNGHGKGQSSQKIHPQGLEGIVDGLIGTGIADKKERTERCDFPESVHVQEIVGHNQAKHG